MNKTPEEIFYKHLGDVVLTNEQSVKIGIIEAMKEYARQERDRALDWAAKYSYAGYLGNGCSVVVEESILAGKTHPDLAI